MKKFLGICFSAVVLASVAASGAACAPSGGKTLYVYTESGFAPYEYLSDSGKVVGVDIDIMNAIGKELGYEVVVNDVAFDAIPSYVQGNKNAVAAAAAASHRPLSSAVISPSFSSKPSTTNACLPAMGSAAGSSAPFIYR